MVQGTINIIGSTGTLPPGAEYLLLGFFIFVLTGFAITSTYYKEKYSQLKEELRLIHGS